MKPIHFILVVSLLMGYGIVFPQRQPLAASRTQQKFSGMDRQMHRAGSPTKLKKEQETGNQSVFSNLSCPTDLYEPNDSLAVAYPISYGQTLYGAYICPSGDLDYFVFHARSGEQIIAYVTASQSGSQLDPMLGLYDSEGVELAFNDDFNGLDPLIKYSIPANGVYYLCVASFSNKTAPNDFYAISLSGVAFHDIRGTVFNDVNHNGMEDSSETGLAGWTIQLQGGAGVTTTVTDSNGAYSFLNMPTNYYTVTEERQAGWVELYPWQQGFYLMTDTVANFANYQAPPSRVYGTLFNDPNHNEFRDSSEVGLEGWSVFIGVGGILNNFDTTVVTDSSGNYSVSGVPAGYCRIYLSDYRPGWIETLPGGGYCSILLAGLDSEFDFGEYFPPPNKIFGVKFEDVNENGVRDIGEAGLPNWTIELRRYNGSRAVLDTTTVTDENGLYKFENLIYGNYGVFEQSQSGWVSTYPPAGYYYYHYLLSDTVEADFGNWNSGGAGDLLCTFSAQQLESAASNIQRPSKLSIPQKPTVPNYANIVNTVISGIKIGLSGQNPFSAGNTEMAYLYPSSYKDVWTTFWKSSGHTHAARGFDFDDLGKDMRKRWKNIPPNKKNDVLIRDLLTFKINLLASADSLTHPGLGALTYFDPEGPHPLHGKTLSQIAAFADTIMTLWCGVPYATYVMLDTVVAKINDAFATPSFAYNAAAWAMGTLYVQGIKNVSDVSFLHGGPVMQPLLGVRALRLPDRYELHQNYPNPFNPSTTIAYDLPTESQVSVKVYDILGQEVATLVSEKREAGAYTVNFDASALPSGAYFCRLHAGTFTQTRKLMLMK